MKTHREREALNPGHLRAISTGGKLVLTSGSPIEWEKDALIIAHFPHTMGRGEETPCIPVFINKGAHLVHPERVLALPFRASGRSRLKL